MKFYKLTHQPGYWFEYAVDQILYMGSIDKRDDKYVIKYHVEVEPRDEDVIKEFEAFLQLEREQLHHDQYDYQRDINL